MRRLFEDCRGLLPVLLLNEAAAEQPGGFRVRATTQDRLQDGSRFRGLSGLQPRAGQHFLDLNDRVRGDDTPLGIEFRPPPQSLSGPCRVVVHQSGSPQQQLSARFPLGLPCQSLGSCLGRAVAVRLQIQPGQASQCLRVIGVPLKGRFKCLECLVELASTDEGTTQEKEVLCLLASRVEPVVNRDRLRVLVLAGRSSGRQSQSPHVVGGLLQLRRASSEVFSQFPWE